ncbi:MAG: hypothetical protein ACRBCI_00560 [Cellvibrionaceae bacterium]
MLVNCTDNDLGVSTSIEEIKEWSPIRLKRDMFGNLRVVWAKFDGVSFTGESFFSREIKRYESNYVSGNGAGYLETDVEALLQSVSVRNFLPLKGLILHTSHSGSTLVNNMLGALEKNLAVSEPVILKDWSRLYGADSRQHSVKNDLLIKSILAAYGEKRTGVEQNFIVKLNSWHMFSSRVFSSAYQSIPWLCIYRHPIEILMGRVKRDLFSNYTWVDRGVGLVLSNEQKIRASAVELMARNLGYMYRYIRENFVGKENIFCVDYGDFSNDLYEKILRHFSLPVSEDEFSSMFSASQYHSKSDSKDKKAFVSDSEERRKNAPKDIISLVEHYALKEYELLRESLANN